MQSNAPHEGDITNGERRNERTGGRAERGERGGQTTKERYGSEFYREIGRRGGETVRANRGREFYEDIGRRGGQRVRELINAAKKSAE